MVNPSDSEPRRRGRPPSGGREAIIEATLELIRERGIAHVTSRDVAARAGVSDASVYYHFNDRAGLLRAVFEHGMKPLTSFAGMSPGALDPREALRIAEASLEQFFIEVLPILHAAQADPELGAAVAAYVEEQDLGPHKGVESLGAYLRAEQQAGRVNPDADVEAIALMVINIAYGRAGRQQMLPSSEERVPPPERLLKEINRLLD